jgi:hypothetical protein
MRTTSCRSLPATKQGSVSGTAKITAVSAGHRASYEWQYSVDGGKTWVTAPATMQAKAGEGDWSQAVALLVK